MSEEAHDDEEGSIKSQNPLLAPSIPETQSIPPLAETLPFTPLSANVSKVPLKVCFALIICCLGCDAAAISLKELDVVIGTSSAFISFLGIGVFAAILLQKDFYFWESILSLFICNLGFCGYGYLSDSRGVSFDRPIFVALLAVHGVVGFVQLYVCVFIKKQSMQSLLFLAVTPATVFSAALVCVSVHYWRPLDEILPNHEDFPLESNYSGHLYRVGAGTISSVGIQYTYLVFIHHYLVSLTIPIVSVCGAAAFDALEMEGPEIDFSFVIGDAVTVISLVVMLLLVRKKVLDDEKESRRVSVFVPEEEEEEVPEPVSESVADPDVQNENERDLQDFHSTEESTIEIASELPALHASTTAAIVAVVSTYPTKCPFVKSAWVDCFPWEVSLQHKSSDCTHLISCSKCGIQDIEFRNKAQHDESCFMVPQSSECAMCGETVSPEQTEQHILTCPGIPIPCPLQCGLLLTRTEMPSHTAEQCPNRYSSSCPNGCGATFKNNAERILHQEQCVAQAILCPLGCGETVGQDSLFSHMYDVCPRRVISCPDSCGEFILSVNELEHRDKCRYRPVECPRGCSMKVPFLELASHVETACAAGQFCPLNCGMHIEHWAVAKHVDVDCSRRENVTGLCPLGCGERDFTVNHILDAECPLTRLLCPNNCGSMVSKKSLMKHCVTSCPKRVTLPSTLPRPLHCPRKCGSLLVSSYSLGNETAKAHFLQSCQSRDVTCPICSSTFPVHKFIKHFGMCAGSSATTGLVSCPHSCNMEIEPTLFVEHCKRSCSMYLQCPLGCGESLRERHINSHLSRYCSNRYISCNHGCGAAIQYKDFFDHNNSCPLKPDICPFQGCGMKVPVGEPMLRHITNCRKKPVLCSNDCGLVLRAEDVTSHASTCKKGGRKSLCPWGCPPGEKDRHFDPEDLIDQHLHKCKNRMTGCQNCGEMVPISQMPQHYWTDCQSKVVTCQYLDCLHKGPYREMGSHYGTECDLAPRPCPLGCGAVLGNQMEQSDHVKLSCPRLLQRCPVVSCPIFRTRHELIDHIVDCPHLQQSASHSCVLGCGSDECSIEICPNMLVECVYCSDVFDRKKIDAHQRQFCRGSSEVQGLCPCCKGTFPKNEVIEHTWTCTGKPPLELGNRYCCPLGCGNELFTAVELESHIGACPLQPLKCRLCGAFAPRNQPCECQLHSEVDRQAELVPTQIRMINCPNNCGDYISEAALVGHYEKNCPNKLVPCRYGCGIPQKICATADHLERHCPKRPIRCTWCLSFVSASDLCSHRSLQCPVKPIPCKLGCGILSFTDREYEDHLKKHCSRRLISCPLQCGVQIPIFALISHIVLCYHQAKEMPDEDDKEVELNHPCPCCGVSINMLEFPQHRSSGCEYLEVACPSGCDTTVYKKDLASHLNNVCSFRKVNCYLGCGELVPFQQIRSHELYQCRMLQAPCPHHGCEEVVQKVRIKLHIEKECLWRPVSCCVNCNCVVAPPYLEAHRLQCQAGDFEKACDKCLVRGCETELSGPYHQWCPKKLLSCPLGCGIILSSVDVASHCDEVCENRSTLCKDCGDPIFVSDSESHSQICPSRFLPCSLGCGTNVKWSQLPVHTAQYCPKRRNTCSYGCGEVVPVHEENDHQKICPYRPSKCALCEGVFHANSNHKDRCRKRMVFCSYCRMPMPAETLSAHLKQCTDKVGSCQYCGVHLKEDALQQHELDCDQRNNCGECGAAGFATRIEMEKHMLKSCPHRKIYCQHCRGTVKASELDDHHNNDCKQFPTMCVICRGTFPRDVIQVHTSRCSQLEVNFQKIKTLKPFVGLDVVDYSRTGVSIAAVVVKVKEPSAATAAGITTGSVILTVNDRAIRNRTSFVETLRDIQPFQNLTIVLCPSDLVASLQGTRIADPEDHRGVLLQKSNTIQLVVGCIPHLSWIEYCCCKSRVTMTCVTFIEKVFTEIGGGSARLSLSEIALLNERLGVSPGEKSVESTSVSSVGYSLIDYLDWLRACNHIGAVEDMVAGGRY